MKKMQELDDIDKDFIVSYFGTYLDDNECLGSVIELSRERVIFVPYNNGFYSMRLNENGIIYDPRIAELSRELER